MRSVSLVWKSSIQTLPRCSRFTLRGCCWFTLKECDEKHDLSNSASRIQVPKTGTGPLNSKVLSPCLGDPQVIGVQEFCRPAIVIEQSGGGSVQYVIGEEQCFDGRQAVVGIGALFRDPGIGGAKAVQGPRRDVEVLARH